MEDFKSYNESLYDDKSNTVIKMYREVTKEHKEFIKSNIFTFNIFGIKPFI